MDRAGVTRIGNREIVKETDGIVKGTDRSRENEQDYLTIGVEICGLDMSS